MALLSCWGIYRFYYAAFLSTLTIGLIAGVLIVGNSACLFNLCGHHRITFQPFQNAALIIAGTMFVAVCSEAFLAWREQRISYTSERSSVVSAEGHGGIDMIRTTSIEGRRFLGSAMASTAG